MPIVRDDRERRYQIDYDHDSSSSSSGKKASRSFVWQEKEEEEEEDQFHQRPTRVRLKKLLTATLIYENGSYSYVYTSNISDRFFESVVVGI